MGRTRYLGMGAGGVRSLNGPPCEAQGSAVWGVPVLLKERSYIAREEGAIGPLLSTFISQYIASQANIPDLRSST